MSDEPSEPIPTIIVTPPDLSLPFRLSPITDTDMTTLISRSILSKCNETPLPCQQLYINTENVLTRAYNNSCTTHSLVTVPGIISDNIPAKIEYSSGYTADGTFQVGLVFAYFTQLDPSRKLGSRCDLYQATGVGGSWSCKPSYDGLSHFESALREMVEKRIIEDAKPGYPVRQSIFFHAGDYSRPIPSWKCRSDEAFRGDFYCNGVLEAQNVPMTTSLMITLSR